MRFLMLVCVDRDADKVPNTRPEPEIDDWVDKYDGQGVRIVGDRIRPDAEAVCVRVRGDEVVVTDGPFVETKEVVAGFDVIEARDRQHAIEIVSEHPMAYAGVIELRAFWDD